jgi:hypothetical protein
LRRKLSHLSFNSIFCARFYRFFDASAKLTWGTFHIAYQGNLNLVKMQGHRTLEISVELDWEEIEEVGSQSQHNPLKDAMRTWPQRRIASNISISI